MILILYFNFSDILFRIIDSSEEEYLTDLMIEKFYDDCTMYIQLENLIFENSFVGISYKNKNISFFLSSLFCFIFYACFICLNYSACLAYSFRRRLLMDSNT